MKINQIKRKIRKLPFASHILIYIYKLTKKAIKYPENKKRAALLNKRLEKLKKEKSKRMWYFGFPTHCNLGDLAQGCCIYDWLNENYPEYEIVTIKINEFRYLKSKAVKKLNELIKQDEIVFFQSGYTMTENSENDKMRRYIIKVMPDKRYVILPQTVFYKTKKLERKAKDVYNGHDNLLLLTRDRVSYEKACEIFPDTKIHNFPDIVTSRIGKYTFENDRSGILFCMRNDIEQHYEDFEIKKLMDKMSKLDSIEMTDTNADIDVKKPHTDIWETIMKTIKEYSKYKLIVTDRYHGTIFALIAATPVVILDNTDHKLRTGAEWFHGVYDDYAVYVNDLSKVQEAATEMINKKHSYKLDSYFDEEYYKGLKALIEREV